MFCAGKEKAIENLKTLPRKFTLGSAAFEPKYIDQASPRFAKQNCKQRTDCIIPLGLFCLISLVSKSLMAEYSVDVPV